MELNKIYNEDCLIGMKKIPNKSVDMILCDLPYGTTRNKWDVVIDFDELWSEYKRIIKERGIIVLTASEPFTSQLIMSNKKWFKYDLVWKKTHPKGHLNAKRMPLRGHENILIFYKKTPNYNPMMRKGKYRYKGNKGFNEERCYGKSKKYDNWNDLYYPTSIIEISNANQMDKFHPTQKPVTLFEYLIKTYTNEGETVLDNCMGSGTTAIACMNTNRNYIGFELDKDYFELANERIEKHTKQMELFTLQE